MGGLKRCGNDSGFLLADALIGLLLLTTGMGGLAMSLGTAARLIAVQEERIVAAILEKNSLEAGFHEVLSSKE